jgi:hypothetical protein
MNEGTDPHARSFVSGPGRISELLSLAALQSQHRVHSGTRTESPSLADSQVDNLQPGGGTVAQELLWPPHCGPVGFIGNEGRSVM